MSKCKPSCKLQSILQLTEELICIAPFQHILNFLAITIISASLGYFLGWVVLAFDFTSS